MTSSRISLDVWILLLCSLTVAASADGGRKGILFQTTRDGNSEIYVMEIEGTGETNLTNNPGEDVQADWSPDGLRIAFASDRSGDNEIYVMNSDGTDQRRITNSPADENRPSWSPDGERIAFETNRTGNYEIFVMDADGTHLSNLTDNDADEINPHWSPDGGKIEFASYRGGPPDIFVMDFDGTNVVQLTHNLWTGQAAWSPDGSRITYSYDRYVAVMNADGTHQTVLLTLTCCPGPSVGSWSSDGHRIVFGTDRLDGNWEIYMISSHGTGLTRLTNNPDYDDDPVWLPSRAGVEPDDINPEDDPVSLPTTSLLESEALGSREVPNVRSYPNPFNPSVTIEFSLSSAGYTTLKIFDILGKEVGSLVERELSKGKHRVEWNATGQPSGMYFYRLQAGGLTQTKKLVLVR